MDGRNECPQCGRDMHLEILDENGAHYGCPSCDYEYCDTSITDEISEEEEKDIQQLEREYEKTYLEKKTEKISPSITEPKSNAGKIIIFILVVIWILFCLKYCNNNGIPEKGL